VNARAAPRHSLCIHGFLFYICRHVYLLELSLLSTSIYIIIIYTSKKKRKTWEGEDCIKELCVCCEVALSFFFFFLLVFSFVILRLIPHPKRI